MDPIDSPDPVAPDPVAPIRCIRSKDASWQQHTHPRSSRPLAEPYSLDSVRSRAWKNHAPFQEIPSADRW